MRDSLAMRVPTHHECKDLTKEGKLQWIDVLRGCRKHTGKLCWLLQPWKRRVKGRIK